jgi:hypothetical protein
LHCQQLQTRKKKKKKKKKEKKKKRKKEAYFSKRFLAGEVGPSTEVSHTQPNHQAPLLTAIFNRGFSHTTKPPTTPPNSYLQLSQVNSGKYRAYLNG